ncbi:HAD family phosphatase [Candidatus Woesebacteria bacterium]|jgi:hypothetical protein|nr:HAD family phosphatase [Candidatus Woesebacteria bacterium]
MIRAVILDIDGVLVGEKIGYNSPNPHPEVISAVQKIHTANIPVTFCTGKPHYAIKSLIDECGLDNPHITDGGALVIDPITQRIVKKYPMSHELVEALIDTYLGANIYMELYTPDGYIIQKNQFRENLTPVHTHVLQTPPMIVDSLKTEAKKQEVIKVMPIAKNDQEKVKLMKLFEPFSSRATLSMGVHPIANPHQFGLITAHGVSKKQSALDAIHTLGIDMSDCLGVGDSTSDWQFMELCGYASTLGNGSTELKNLVNVKNDRGFITDKSVDENGILSIFEHFSLS